MEVSLTETLYFYFLRSMINFFAVAQLVEALRYKSLRRRFGSLWGYWNFS
jgi:hypothetical protein